jgi:hypothetical protein
MAGLNECQNQYGALFSQDMNGIGPSTLPTVLCSTVMELWDKFDGARSRALHKQREYDSVDARAGRCSRRMEIARKMK